MQREYLSLQDLAGERKTPTCICSCSDEGVNTRSFWRGLIYPLAEAMVALRYGTVYPPGGMDNTISWRFPLSPVLRISYPPAVSRIGKASKIFSCTCWLLPPLEKHMLFSSSPARAIDTFSKVEGAVVAFFFSRHTNVLVHVFRTGMLMRSPVDVATTRRLGAGSFPFLELVLILTRLLFGGL